MSDADVQARLRAYRDATLGREVSPEAWPRLQRRLRREPWRRAGLAAAAVALVVVAVVGSGLVVRWTGREPAVASQPTVAARIPLGCTLSLGARNLEVGFGAVWVACDGALLRIDPATNQIAAVIPLEWMTANAGIALSDDSVWVTSASSTHPVVYQLDPARNREVSRTPVPGDANGIVIVEGSIWVSLEGPEPGSSGQGTVARFDADTGARLPPVELPWPPTGIHSGLGAVWVTTDRPNESAVYRIDPRSRTVTRVPRAQSVVTAGPDSLWVTTDNPPTAIHRIDPGSGRVLATAAAPGIRRMAFGAGALWALADAKLSRLDPISGQLVGTPVTLPGASAALAVDAGSVWVADQGTETAITRLTLTP